MIASGPCHPDRHAQRCKARGVLRGSVLRQALRIDVATRAFEQRAVGW
jgi:hypothetical protein